jgi:hypothetical protein
MNCSKIEQKLSAYMESSLPVNETSQVEEHLKSCRQCSELLHEMRSVAALCQSYPTLQLQPDLLEKILLRTSGRPRTLSFQERLQKYFWAPLLTPRFAAGAVLATLFLALSLNLMMPRISTALSLLSPPEMLRMLDRGVQTLYSKGLRVYNKTSELQDHFIFFKNDTVDKMRFFFERMEIPVEGRKKSEEPVREKESTPKEKRSHLLMWPA